MKKIGIGVGVLVVIAAVGMLGMKVKKVSVKARAPEVEKAVAASQAGFYAAFKDAQALEAKGELLAARDIYKDLVMTYASRQDIEGVQNRLEDLNIRIILSAINVDGQTTVRQVEEGDSLSMIADEYRTTAEFIKRENGLTSDMIRPGQRLRIWIGRFSILVDKSQNILTLKSDGEVIKTFRVSTGKDNITPVGTFKIVNKLRNPSWTHDGKLIPPGDAENILGTRWLGFDIPSYGIHGTTQPETIGQQATAGCVRMLNKEIELLYDLLPVNTEVAIID